MNRTEELLHALDTLKDSIRHDWLDLSTLPLPPEERSRIKTHIQLCMAELQELGKKL